MEAIAGATTASGDAGGLQGSSRLAWPGAALLFIASLTTLARAQGAPTLYIGFAGFVIWGIFLIACGVGLLRSAEAT